MKFDTCSRPFLTFPGKRLKLNKSKAAAMLIPKPKSVVFLVCAIALAVGCGKKESGEDAGSTATMSPAEQVKAAVTEFYTSVVSEDEATRLAAIDKIMFSEEDFVTLFGNSDGVAMWNFYKQNISGMKEDSAQVKGEVSKQGKLENVKLIDLRMEPSEMYPELFKAISEDVPCFDAVLAFENGEQPTGAYVLVNGRVAFARRLDRMYKHVMSEKK